MLGVVGLACWLVCLSESMLKGKQCWIVKEIVVVWLVDEAWEEPRLLAKIVG